MEEPYVDRTSLPMLHPSLRNGVKWFKHHTEVSTVEVEFNKLAAYQLKGMISLAKKEGKKPDWILSDDWKIMQEYWATPRAKENSEKARASRMSDRNGLGVYSHVVGSRSFLKLQDNLEANNEDFSFIAVMKKAHRKPDGTYVDQRAQLVAETYEKHVQERLGQLESSGEENVTAENLDHREKNEIYLKAAACSSKQCHVFGLGVLRNEVLPAFEASSSAQQPSEEPEMITQRLQEVEAELKQSREEKLEFYRRFESMEKIVQSLASHNA